MPRPAFRLQQRNRSKLTAPRQQLSAPGNCLACEHANSSKASKKSKKRCWLRYTAGHRRYRAAVEADGAIHIVEINVEDWAAVIPDQTIGKQ